jgi:dipeptidyl aminopeptidase/acylaminoacyl peptidase
MWQMLKLTKALVVVLATTGLAQVAQPQAAATPTNGPGTGSALRTLDPADLSFWKTIRNATTSNDGRWFAYLLAPNEGNAEVVMRSTSANAQERRFAVGEPPEAAGGFGGGGASAPVVFSGDGKWLAFSTYPTAEETRKLRKDRKPIQNNVSLVDIGTGATRVFEKVRRFSFAGERPDWIVLHRYAAEGASASDLLLVDLRSGGVSTIGSVGEYALDRDGAYLAWTTDVRDRVGNGVQLRQLATDVVRSLDSEKALYRRLTWADSGLALGVLRGQVDSAASDTSYAVVGWTIPARGAPERATYAPGSADGFPAGMRISPDRAPRWSTDRSAIFFGITARRVAPESKTPRPDVRPVAGTPGAMQSPAGAGATEDDLPSVVIWHGKGDPRLQSQQQVEESRDKTFSYLAQYRVADQRFHRLSDDELRDVQLTPRDRHAWGADRRAYERRDAIDGGQRRDLFAIDLRTGERSLLRRTARFGVTPSPDGTRLLFFDDGEYHVYDFATKATTTITQGGAFINTEDDHNVDRPPRQPLGWATDSRHVLLFDGWDVWRVPVGGGAMANLTLNGKRDRIRYTRRIVVNPEERGIDLTRPIYLQTYGEWTKKEGLARIMPGKPGAESLLWSDARYFVSRARDADMWIFTRQTFQEFPDYHAADRGAFASAVRLTDANPQQRDFAWSAGARLVDYVSDKGDTLQGALFLPAGYEPGKQYPTVVYIYEKLSQGLHQYAVPNETRAFNPSIYTSRGYAVLMPDIVYKINDPGMSSVWCVVPAVKAAIATGIVDSARIGLHGHSWGGYQSSFLATQTGRLFKGIVTGAPLTDMISMYNSVYWNTGTADMAIFESSQGRFTGSYLDNHDAYIRNSPAFFAHKVETPVMILHNERDGAVDFNQGITWFNTLREQEKDVIMLQYVGENHGLRLPKNQKDYTIRMTEYFDTFLRGAPAPEWILSGVPRLRMEEHLKARQKKAKIAS